LTHPRIESSLSLFGIPGEVNIRSFKTSAIVAYYHIPPVWIGTNPLQDGGASKIDERCTRKVFRRKLPQGIKAHVRRDGLFAFDFSGWEAGSSVVIPEISIKGDKPERPPKELFESLALEQAKMYRRVEAMNAHIACLYSCMPTVEPVYQVCSPSDHIDLSKAEQRKLSTSGLDYFPLQAFIKVHTEFKKYLSGERVRGVMPLDTVENSFALYERLLNCHVEGSLNLAVLLLQAAKACAEHDFATCVIFSWVVCEKLIANLWEKLIQDNRAREVLGQNTPFIKSDRKKRLEDSSVYSAAVIIEILSLQDLIPLTMYENLTATRKKRNKWIHHLEAIDYTSASKAIRVAQDLLDQVGKVRLRLNPGAQARLVPSA
jgi:hypothetical protein